MLLKHFFVGKIAHSSYILAGKESCAVVDPRRDVDLYIREARELGVKITHILETHLHADFISGHIDLAEKTGARIYAPKSADCSFPHRGLSEGDTISLEDIELRILETPGHTPEHISYVVVDKSRADEPAGVFVGDTLFVGDVGRPDLFPDIARDLAAKLYHSLHHKLLKLPDYCEVYPAHGAGSLCGRSMGAKWRSTIGYERRYNPALKIKDQEEFILSLTTNMPPAPDHFSRCSDINRRGPEMIENLPALVELVPEQFQARMEGGEFAVLDARSYDSFGSQHIPGAWHIGLGGNFPTFTGWVLPPDQDFLLVVETYSKAREVITWARRVGMDRISGYLNGGMNAWAVSGYQTANVRQISVKGLYEMLNGSTDIILVDVRAPREYEDSHIEGGVNIPAPDLRRRYQELDPEKPVVLICSTGNRSSLAASILKQHGFTDLYNVAGGFTGYSAAGLVKRCRVCENPHGSRFFEDYRQASQQWTGRQ
jgi:glyoxylase-like metal-dependent hydrolase (beta-lactamase superfamily II)/rhodanese-related sulfurtransferase